MKSFHDLPEKKNASLSCTCKKPVGSLKGNQKLRCANCNGNEMLYVQFGGLLKGLGCYNF